MKRLLVLALLAAGCASNKKFVADQTAARMYHHDRYTRACVDVKGPATCKEMQAVLVLLFRHEPKGCDLKQPGCSIAGLIPLANEVQQVGEIPKMERKELKALMKTLEGLP